MARQYKILVSGKIDNYVFYNVNDKGYVRSAPGKVNVSKATRKWNKEFKQGARLSAELRGGLKRMIPEAGGKLFMYPLNNVLGNWFKQGCPLVDHSITQLNRLQIRKDRDTTECIKKEIIVQWDKKGKGKINLPALVRDTDLKFPASADTMRIELAAAACDIKREEALANWGAKLELDLTRDSYEQKEFEFDLFLKKGQVAVVAISIRFHHKKNGAIKERKKGGSWQPMQIVGSYVE